MRWALRGLVGLLLTGSAAGQDVEYVMVGVKEPVDDWGWEGALARIDPDGTPTVVGTCGLGRPGFDSLIWVDDRLLGLGGGSVAAIDLTDGVSERLGIAFPSVGHVTYDPVDAFLYAVKFQDTIIRIDPGTWTADFVYSVYRVDGIAFGENGPDRQRGLYILESGTLSFLDVAERTLRWIASHSGLWECNGLIWNPATEELWCHDDPPGGNRLYVIEMQTGERTLRVELDDAVSAIAFIPKPDPAPPTCDYVDADRDGDIDLEDFAVFMLCFGTLR